MKPRSPVKVPRNNLKDSPDKRDHPVIGKTLTPIVHSLKRKRLFLKQKRPKETRDMCADNWELNFRARSHEAYLLSPTCVMFHPGWSNGHAAILGNQPLNKALVHYWEIAFSERVFGTAMQVGVATKDAQLHVHDFVTNLIGMDKNSWGLSHKGLTWHDGICKTLCPPFSENEGTTIGVLYNGPKGTVSFFKDNMPLGEAFTGLNKVEEDLYPILSSTAARTCMKIVKRFRSYESLEDRCRAVLVRLMENNPTKINSLPLPTMMKKMISESVPANYSIPLIMTVPPV